MFKFLLLSLLAMAAGRDDLESVLSQIFGSSTPATGNTGSGTNTGNVGGSLGNNNGATLGSSTNTPPGINNGQDIDKIDDTESVLSQIFGSSTPATGNTGSGTNTGNVGGSLGNNNGATLGSSTNTPPGINNGQDIDKIDDTESVLSQIFGSSTPATGNTGSGTNTGNVGGSLGNNNGATLGSSTNTPPGINNGQDKNDDIESLINQIFGASTPATGNTTGSGTNAGNIGGNLGNNNGPSTVIPPGTNDVPKNDSCTTVNNEKGKCVKYYLCDRNDTVFNASTGINLSVIVDRCSSYLDVCCRLPNQQFPDNQEKNESEQVPNSEAHRSGCGWRNPEGLGMKINSGTNGEANHGEFPWVVVVYSRFYIDNHANPDAFSYKGVGSLIHPSVVLTAAHILTNYDEIEEPEFQVRAGNWKLYPDNELYQHQDRHVESTLIHKDFNSGNVFYDAALLYLSRPMELAPNVGIACLPPPRERVAGGTQCFSSWWPRESDWEAILTKEQVQVVDYNSCRNDLRKTRLGEMSELHTSFMCTRDDRSSSVVDGAPLVCPIEFQDGRYMQSGIVALNVGSEGNMLYVDVSNIRDWIDDKVKGKGYSTPEYSFNI